MVCAVTFVIGFIMIMRFYSRHLRQNHAAHQPVHSSDADADAIVTLQYIFDLICAKAFIVISIYVQYQVA